MKWKSSKSIVKWKSSKSIVKWKSSKSVVNWSKVKGSEVKCGVGKGWKRDVMGRVYMGSKVVRGEGLGSKRVCKMCGEKY